MSLLCAICPCRLTSCLTQNGISTNSLIPALPPVTALYRLHCSYFKCWRGAQGDHVSRTSEELTGAWIQEQQCLCRKRQQFPTTPFVLPSLPPSFFPPFLPPVFLSPCLFCSLSLSFVILFPSLSSTFPPLPSLHPSQPILVTFISLW